LRRARPRQYKDSAARLRRAPTPSQPPSTSTSLPMAPRHRGAEPMHWPLDVDFKDGLSRCHNGPGAKNNGPRTWSKNLAILPRFAPSLVGADKRKGSVKKQIRRLERCCRWGAAGISYRPHWLVCRPRAKAMTSDGAKTTLRQINGMRLVAQHLPHYRNVIKSHQRRCSPSAPAASC
jgi:hypothetical protein